MQYSIQYLELFILFFGLLCCGLVTGTILLYYDDLDHQIGKYKLPDEFGYNFEHIKEILVSNTTVGYKTPGGYTTVNTWSDMQKVDVDNLLQKHQTDHH